MKRLKAGRSSQHVDSDLMEVLNGFRRILRALRMAAGETQARFGVSAAQLYVLEELSAAGHPLSIRELAERTMTDRSSVADVVERLTAGEYVTREQSVSDRRRAEIRITSVGEHLARSAPKAPTMLLLSGLRQLSHAELRALARSMARLLEEMGLTEAKAGMLFEDEPTAKSSRAE